LIVDSTGIANWLRFIGEGQLQSRTTFAGEKRRQVQRRKFQERRFE
jgi:hypothetical protein